MTSMKNVRTTPTSATPNRLKDRAACPSLREQAVRVWAQALFCSPLRPTDRPDAFTVCQTIVEQLTACSALPGGCAELVAHEAGEYPENFPERMAWCQSTVDRAYSTLLTPLRTASL